MSNQKKKTTIKESLSQLEKIIAWFDDQKDVDVEKGVQKVREGLKLIDEISKDLKEVENEFRDITKK